MCIDVGSNSSVGSRSLAASLSFQATVPPSAQSPTFNVEGRVSEGGGWARSFNVETQGPPLQDLDAGCAETFVRGAALGRRRFAPPRRARSRQLPPRWRIDWEWLDPYSQQTFGRWTLLDAAPSAGGLIEVRTYGGIGPGVPDDVRV